MEMQFDKNKIEHISTKQLKMIMTNKNKAYFPFRKQVRSKIELLQICDKQ